MITYAHYFLTIVLLLTAGCIAVGMMAGQNQRPLIVLYWLLLTIRYTLEILKIFGR